MMDVAKARLIVLLLSILSLFGAWVLYGEPLISDAVEYTVGAYRMFHDDGFTLSISGQEFPSRYQPAFSILFAAPLLAFFKELRLGALIPALFSSFGGIAAFEIGFSISGIAGGLLSAFFLLSIPGYLYFGGMAMTDVPITVLTLISLLYFIRSKERNLLPCLLGALAFALKPTAAFLLVPWIYERLSQRKILGAIFLILPTISAIFFALIYNASTFGSAFRTGYHYWVSVPYDFPSLIFSAKYLLANINKELIPSGILFLLLLIAVAIQLLRKKTEDPLKNTAVQLTVRFLALITIPYLIFYLFYFYHTVRFILPLTAIAAILLGALLGKLLAGYRYLPAITATAFFIIVVVKLPFSELPIESNNFEDVIPEGALVITTENPVLVTHYLPGRIVVPYSRDVEYASKYVMKAAPNISETPPSADLQRWEPLKKAGAEEAVSWVALESMDLLKREIKIQGGYLILGNDPKIDMEGMRRNFVLIKLSPNIFEMLVSRLAM
jgi:4-amino-4-deoxy-L-arabinose transferase-like glycosyltransferase